MMLDTIVARQEKLVRKITAGRSEFTTTMRVIFARVREMGSPKGAAGDQTVGVHIDEPLRLQLRVLQKAWGFKGYRDTVYAVICLGVEVLKKEKPPE